MKNYRKTMALFFSSILGGTLLIGTATGDTTPKELGRVHWQRDFDGVLLAAQESHKPVFVLFQEVPGCQTCVSFGEQVLSNPLLVEAIETEFIPVFVYNNRSGKDAEIDDHPADTTGRDCPSHAACDEFACPDRPSAHTADTGGGCRYDCRRRARAGADRRGL